MCFYADYKSDTNSIPTLMFDTKVLSRPGQNKIWISVDSLISRFFSAEHESANTSTLILKFYKKFSKDKKKNLIQNYYPENIFNLDDVHRAIKILIGASNIENDISVSRPTRQGNNELAHSVAEASASIIDRVYIRQLRPDGVYTLERLRDVAGWCFIKYRGVFLPVVGMAGEMQRKRVPINK